MALAMRERRAMRQIEMGCGERMGNEVKAVRECGRARTTGRRKGRGRRWKTYSPALSTTALSEEGRQENEKDKVKTSGDIANDGARKLRRQMSQLETGNRSGDGKIMKRWEGPKVGLALGRKWDMDMGAELDELVQKDSVFDDYINEGKLPGRVSHFVALEK